MPRGHNTLPAMTRNDLAQVVIEKLTSAAAELGRLGGAARARKLSAEQRAAIAKRAAQNR